MAAEHGHTQTSSQAQRQQQPQTQLFRYPVRNKSVPVSNSRVGSFRPPLVGGLAQPPCDSTHRLDRTKGLGSRASWGYDARTPQPSSVTNPVWKYGELKWPSFISLCTSLTYHESASLPMVGIDFLFGVIKIVKMTFFFPNNKMPYL